MHGATLKKENSISNDRLLPYSSTTKLTNQKGHTIAHSKGL